MDSRLCLLQLGLRRTPLLISLYSAWTPPCCHDRAWGLRGGQDTENTKCVGQVCDWGGLSVRWRAVRFDDLGDVQVGDGQWCGGARPDGPGRYSTARASLGELRATSEVSEDKGEGKGEVGCKGLGEV